MKLRATQKQIREHYPTIIRIGYCDMQHLLRFENPFAYLTRPEGWACNVYDVDGIAISTGYSPFGNVRPHYALVRAYEENAKEIQCVPTLNIEEMRDKTTALLRELLEIIRVTREDV